MTKHINPYNTTKWRKLRRHILYEEPFCRMCRKVGRTKEAEHIDHIIPLKRRPDLMFDEDNLQPLCEDCHRDKTGTENRRKGMLPDGTPFSRLR